jgi:hypothetical protein
MKENDNKSADINSFLLYYPDIDSFFKTDIKSEKNDTMSGQTDLIAELTNHHFLEKLPI